MVKVMYLQSSPRKERSYSNRVAEAFIKAYAKKHPEDEVIVRDVFTMKLPAFDGPAVRAKYAIMHGSKPSERDRKRWQEVETIIEEFKSVDKYVLATPMWNFGVPYRLKQYIDILVQPGYTFNYSADTGYTGLVVGRPMFAVYARGGDYSQGSGAEAFDLQRRYIETVFGLIGFGDFRTVVVEPTLAGGPEASQKSLARAIEQAERLAEDF